MKRSLWVVLASLAYVGCRCGGTVDVPCSTKAECGPDLDCIGGVCAGGGGGSAGSGGNGGTGGTGGNGGNGGGGTVYTGCDPANPNNGTLDSDCDGLTDAEEYGTSYGGKKTDPCNSDSDGDGVLDGVELGKTTSVNTTCGFVADADPSTKTLPTEPDSDGDGLKDGEEDKNHNGKLDPGESNPLKKDSDCDGISDFDEVKATFGCATDPMNKDSDGDGLPDGVEEGIVAPGADNAACAYPAGTFDADPATKTDACNPDSDGDGIMDGAEDTNHNGKVDPGELDPKNATDGTGPAQQACATANLRPINFKLSGAADLQVALVPEFAEVSKLVDSTGLERGLIFYDATNKIAGLALSRPPVGATATTEEADARAKLGAVTAPITQTFSTWDGFAQSVRGTYDQAGALDLKTRINDLAKAFLGATVTGTLTGVAGATGPFKIQAEYIHRAATRSILLFAIVPAASFTGNQVFRVDDVAGGSAVAQFGDFAGTQCEVFNTSAAGKIDFLWVVDDSCSMASSQTAVANAGALFGNKLASAGLDWRAAAVTTGYYATSYNGSYRDWTTVLATMQTWFSGGSSFGTSGSGQEEGFAGTLSFLNKLGPAPVPGSFRADAQGHLIFLTDTAEQSGTSAAAMATTLDGRFPAPQKWTAHGIICPEGTSCSSGEPTPESNPGKYHTLIRQSGGVIGNINVFNPAAPTAAQTAQQQQTIDAILSAAIAGTGHQLQRPPISATIKLAIETGGTIGACNVADIPRDRINGFDYDSATRRVVFFGTCRPGGVGKKVAVSYKFWNDATPDPAGDPCGNKCADPYMCNPATGQCVCKPLCGGCAANMSCDMATCTCNPGIN